MKSIHGTVGIYIDASEWVEITNTRAVTSFADGGIVGTKPMSPPAETTSKKQGNYCSHCVYDPTKKQAMEPVHLITLLAFFTTGIGDNWRKTQGLEWLSDLDKLKGIKLRYWNKLKTIWSH